MADLPSVKDVYAFDRGYMLGFIHCLEQVRLSLTEPGDNNLFNLHPAEQAKRISVLIDAAREAYNEDFN